MKYLIKGKTERVLVQKIHYQTTFVRHEQPCRLFEKKEMKNIVRLEKGWWI
mgnify:CR=1 FL=1